VPAALACRIQKVPDLQALLRFVRFCLPRDFGTSITIARGGRRPAAAICGSGAVVTAPGLLVPAAGGESGAAAHRLDHGRLGVPDRPVVARRWHHAWLYGAQRHLRRSPACLGAARRRRGQISNVGKGDAGNTPASGRTRASANTSGPDFTLARRPLVKLRSPLEREPHRAKKTLFLLPGRKRERPDR